MGLFTGFTVCHNRCHGVVDSTCDTEFGGTGSIPSHDTKVNSAFHPFEDDK